MSLQLNASQFFDLYDPYDGTIKGLTALLPEINQLNIKQYVEVSYFHDYQSWDMIYFVFNSSIDIAFLDTNKW